MGDVNVGPSSFLPYNPYKFSAYSTAAQNTGNAAFAQVTLGTEEYDTSNNFASSTFTAPVAGFYHFDGHVGTTGTPSLLIVSLFKNGSEFKRGDDLRSAADVKAGNVSATLQLAASDTVDLRTFGSSAVAIDVTQANCYLMGFLVSLT